MSEFNESLDSITSFSTDEGATDIFTTTSGVLQTGAKMMVKSWYPFIIVSMYVMVVGAIPGNTLTIMAFIKYPLLRSPTNYLIVNQSLADIMVSITANFFICFNYTQAGLDFAVQHKYACLVGLYSVFFGLLLSLINMFALSTERLIAVVWSLKYFNWVTEKSVCYFLAAGWCTSLIICGLPLMGWNRWTPGNACMTMNAYPTVYFVYVYTLPIFALLILTAMFNIIISIIAVKKNRVRPEGQSIGTYTVTSKQHGDGHKEATPNTDPSVQSSNVSYKITKMLLMVVGVFYLSWMPYLIMTVLYFVPPNPEWKVTGPPEWYLFLHEFSKSLLGLNGVLNPFIYAYRSSRFRIAFRRLLGLNVTNALQDATF